jgi:hypothetical protein
MLLDEVLFFVQDLNNHFPPYNQQEVLNNKNGGIFRVFLVRVIYFGNGSPFTECSGYGSNPQARPS